MTKALIVLGMGGHTSQMLRLVDRLQNRFRYSYVIGHDDQTSTKKIRMPGKVYTMRNPRLMTDKTIAKVALNMIPSTLDAFRVLTKAKPKVIISSGPSMSIPLFWVAKLLGIKTIFVESWVRVHHKSQTGKLVYPITDLFLVQWPTMKKVYPRAKFAGRLS